METPGNNLAPKNAEFICYCGRVYNSNSGLWKHKNRFIVLKNIVLNKKLKNQKWRYMI